MKNGIFLIVMLLGLGTRAQMMSEDKVRKEVVSTFHDGYKDATDVRWRMEKGNYIAAYRDSGFERYVKYNTDGWRVEAGQLIPDTLCPSPLTTYLKKKYRNVANPKIYMVKSDRINQTVWKAKLNDKTLVFDEQGNYLGRER